MMTPYQTSKLLEALQSISTAAEDVAQAGMTPENLTEVERRFISTLLMEVATISEKYEYLTQIFEAEGH
jgi:hypothetical protein